MFDMVEHDDQSKQFLMPGKLIIGTGQQNITTILGSCVSVVVTDKKNQVWGMNHFILPYKKNCVNSELGKYGNHSIELMLKQMEKMGGDIRNYQAKIYGGFNALKALSDCKTTIGHENIRIALSLLSSSQIPYKLCESLEVGGRKIIVHFPIGQVTVDKIGGDL